MSTRASKDGFDYRHRQSIYAQAIENYQHWQRISRHATNLGLALSMLWVIVLGVAAISGFSVFSLTDAIPPAIINAIANLPVIPTRAAKKQVEAIRKEMNDRSQFESSIQAAEKISDPQMRDETLVQCVLLYLSIPDKRSPEKAKIHGT